ncbi:MAG: hypothetical protein HY698_19955 [Deltaproteobacteria bacterium]|nr:hypothetical protein [Deltaproteobacteria bacterium]
MLAIDSLVLDVILSAKAPPPSVDVLVAALGGEEVAKERLLVDPDRNLPQYEMEISPTVPLRRRGERRLLVIDEATAPMRTSPRTDPIVPRDLRPERERLIQLVEALGARIGRMNAFGTVGDAVIVTRSARDLRGLMLLGWVLDPTTDLDGRQRATPLSQKEFELKFGSFEKRLEEVSDEVILSRVEPAHLERRGDLLIVDVLSDIDGSWDIRKSYDLETRVAALDLFARIPGARAVIQEPAQRPAVSKAPAPPPSEEPPSKPSPPIVARELAGRVILVIPEERLDLDTVSGLGQRHVDVLRPFDQVPGPLKDRIHQQGCGFIAPLAFLSEVFLEGKPLDRKRFAAEATEIAPSVRGLTAHLPRFGPVLVVEASGKRYMTSELTLDIPALMSLLG